MYQADINLTKDFLLKQVQRKAPEKGYFWLLDKLQQISTSGSEKELYISFSAAPRFLDKIPLQLQETDLLEAKSIRKGFDPSRWTTSQAGRTLLLFALPHDQPDAYVQRMENLFATADMNEQLALYSTLPLLPYPLRFTKRATEGIRTNIGDVFEAVALNNPFPADYLEEGPWNQLVLKTLFVSKPLYRIWGLEERSNPRLARMLQDYAHERWAAGRPVSPELWRPVAPYIDDTLLADIKKLFDQPNELEQQAAALACAQSSFQPAKELLEKHPKLKQKVEQKEINWSSLGQRHIIL